MIVVSRMFRVLPSIEFYDEARFHAHEIDDVSGDRLLPPKLEVAQTPSAQISPQQSLDVRRGDTQLRALRMSLRNSMCPTHPCTTLTRACGATSPASGRGDCSQGPTTYRR
jgi:hypothetical protein